MPHLTDDFGKQGYAAVSPALFDRVEKGIELGYDLKSIEAGREIRGKVALDGTLLDLQAAIDYAKPFDKVGCVGYYWCGGLAFLATTTPHTSPAWLGIAAAWCRRMRGKAEGAGVPAFRPALPEHPDDRRREGEGGAAGCADPCLRRRPRLRLR
jgi:dienelactone hydrolase